MSTADPFLPMDDYVAPSDSYTDYNPGEPQERIEQESHDAAIMAASYPVMADVYQWFDEQIEATDSRRNIQAYATSHDLDLNLTSAAFDIVRELLEGKQAEFQQFQAER